MKNKFIFYAALSALPVLLAVVGFFTLLISPYTGIDAVSKDNKWYIASIPATSPLSPYPEILGQEIVSINGYEPGRYDLVRNFGDIKRLDDLEHFRDANRYWDENIKPAQAITLKVKQGAKESVYNITPAHYPPGLALRKVSLTFLVAFVSMLIGLMLVRKKREDERTVILFYIMFFVSWYLFGYASYMSRDISFNHHVLTFLEFTLNLSPLIAYALTLHFVLAFPVRTCFIRLKWFLTALYIIPVAVFAAYQLRVSYSILFVFIILYALGSIFTLVYNYVTLRSPVEKTQARWLVWGISTYLIIVIGTFFPIFASGSSVSQDILLISFIIIPVTIAFAITRYKLMDIDTLFDTTLVYIITIILLSVLDIAIIAILVNIRLFSFNISETVATIIAVWVVIFVYIPVHTIIQNNIKKLLKREIYEINMVAIGFSKELLTVTSISDAFNRIFGTINTTLHPRGINFIFSAEKEYAELFNKVEYTPPPFSIYSPQGIVETTPLFELVQPDKLPHKYSGGILIPIIGSHGHIGSIVLQNKFSGRLYDKEDIKLLNIITNEIALCIETLLSREQIAAQEKEALEEKNRISREIHDGIGGRLVEALIINDTIARNPADQERVLKKGEEVKRILTEGLNDLRELVWTVEHGDNTLGNIIAYIAEKAQTLKNKEDLILDIDIIVENENLPISSKLKLNLLRLMQESVTNILKHADASEVKILIYENKRHLTIKINDNGRGFNTQKVKSTGYGLRNLKKRCEEIGGRFDISSMPGKGTTTLIEINLP